jgi:SAM-dependent methyltransferase
VADDIESAGAFYDALAAEYHALYDDWWIAAQWHAKVVSNVLAGLGVAPPARVLDCACGIGTQAIPLAGRGFAVTGTDLSEAAIARARREAATHGITLDLAVGDMRSVDATAPGPFDAAVCCDNALPHLLTDDDLDAALAAIARTLRPGGAFLASVRDYDVLRAERPSGVPNVVRQREHGREIVGQAWEWDDDGSKMRINLFVLREAASQWDATVFTTWYRALGRRALAAALGRARFTDVRWHEPNANGYYQPIVTARSAE